MAFPKLASEAARSAGIGGWFFISAAVVGGRFPVSEDLPEIAKSPSSFRKQLGTFNRYAFDHCTQRLRPSTRFHCARRMRSMMPAASRRFRASITVERAMPAALAIVSREGSQRPEATLWKWKRRIRRTCRPVRFRHPPCLWGSRVLASIRSARKISRARCSRVSGRNFTGSSVEARRCRRFGRKSVFASAYRRHTASFSSGVLAAFRSSLKSFQNSRLGCLSGRGRGDGWITRSIIAAICSTIGTTLLWRAEARSGERGTGKTPPWLETSVFHLRRGGRFGRIGIAKSFILLSHCPPPWGLWCFWGFLFSSSHLSKIQPIPCRKNCRHSSVSGLIKLAEALTDLREEYHRTRSVNPARHAHPSRRPWRFFGMGCAWLRAAGGGCLRQGFDFRCARWSIWR